MRTLLKPVLIGLALTGGIATADAQVRYQPYPAQPTPYGYPVPGGVLQPDETYGTSPTYVLNPYAGYGQPVVSVIHRCQYPDGWNVTDFHRDINGIPAGVDHTCPAARAGGR